MNDHKIYSVKNEASELESKLSTENIYSFIKKSLGLVDIHYPNFDNWISKIFFETKQIDNNERDIFLIIDENNKKIAGLLILKLSATENKICTLLVLPEYRNKGVASRFIQLALANSNMKLTLTVSEKNFLIFEKLFDKFGFFIIKEENTYSRYEKEFFLETFNKG
jgi:ribosomal protein S18 acetylase RimI-like enzyme